MSDEKPHIALVGFMGSGKTAVGRILAERWGRQFVDLDAFIEEAAGQSVVDIFKEQGEVGFRAQERAATRTLMARETPLVIATGGGTFVDPELQRVLGERARCVYLSASVQTIMERIGQGTERDQRPLLTGPDPSATVMRMLAERAAAYGSADLECQTDQCSVTEVAQQVAKQLHLERVQNVNSRMDCDAGSGTQLEVATSCGEYCVELRTTMGNWVGERVAARARGKQAYVVSDSHVWPLHGEAVAESLRAAGLEVAHTVIPPGEASKSLERAAGLYDALLNVGLGRRDMLIAVGGGVVGDLTGFVASTFLRGIDCFQVPTSTLACVDSSVGGKTGLNTPRGKNLIGTFAPPRGVYIAANHLTTQTRRQHGAGLVEALKMAATMDRALFEQMEQCARQLLEHDAGVLLPTLLGALRLKAKIVARDEREAGDRAILNYGHTVGHAIEAGAGFERPHGECVGLGMIAEAEFFFELGLGPNVAGRLQAALLALGQPVSWAQLPIDVAALGCDKKRIGDMLTVPVVTALGRCILQEVRTSDLQQFIHRRTA